MSPTGRDVPLVHHMSLRRGLLRDGSGTRSLHSVRTLRAVIGYWRITRKGLRCHPLAGLWLYLVRRNPLVLEFS